MPDTRSTQSSNDPSQTDGPDYLNPTPEAAAALEDWHSRDTRRRRRETAQQEFVTARDALKTAVAAIRERRGLPEANAPEPAAGSTPTQSLQTRSETGLQKRNHGPVRLSDEEAAPLMQVATRRTIMEAIKRIIAGMGVLLTPNRIQGLAGLITDEAWTDQQVRIAGVELARSPKFRDTIRYAGTLTLADFAAVIDPPAEAILSTPKGYPLRVAAGKLYSFPEMLSLFEATGGPSGPWQSTGRFAEAVFPPGWIPGTHKPLWRLRLSSDSPNALRQPEPIVQ